MFRGKKPASELDNVSVSLHFSKQHDPDTNLVNPVFNKLSVAGAK
jgi:hypothetical protein